jgi:hypothetical protein
LVPEVAVAVEHPVVVAFQEEVLVDEAAHEVLSVAAALSVVAEVVVVEAAGSRAVEAAVVSLPVEEEVIEHDRKKVSARYNGRRHPHFFLLVLARAHRYLDHLRRLVFGGSCFWKV